LIILWLLAAEVLVLMHKPAVVVEQVVCVQLLMLLAVEDL
jgi:hypothetical protein